MQGQPLATVELLRDLQERGGLVRDSAGCWTARPGLEWSALPARVEAMIAERIALWTSSSGACGRSPAWKVKPSPPKSSRRVVGIAEGDVVRLLSEALDRADLPGQG